MTIIFNVQSDGSVQTAPALVPQGVGVDVVVISPFAGLCTILVTPPDQMMQEPVILSPVLERGKDIIYKGRLPKTTAQTAGKAVYQIQFSDSDGGVEMSYSGSFTVQRGVAPLIPPTVDDLGKMSLEDIYNLLAELNAHVVSINADLSTELIVHDSWTGSVGTVTIFGNTTNIVRNLVGVTIAVSDTAAAEDYWSAVVYVYLPDDPAVTISLPSWLPVAGDDLATATGGDIWEIHINNIGGAICKRVGS